MLTMLRGPAAPSLAQRQAHVGGRSAGSGGGRSLRAYDLVSSWEAAGEVLTLAGGEAGRPSPALQLGLLSRALAPQQQPQQQRRQQPGPGKDGASPSARPTPGGTGNGTGDGRTRSVVAAKEAGRGRSATPTARRRQRPGADADAGGDGSLEPEGAAWGLAGEAWGSAAGLQGEAGWEADWEGQVRKHAAWLLEPSAASPAPGRENTPRAASSLGQAGPAGAATQMPRDAARPTGPGAAGPAVWLPGHLAAAAAAAAAGSKGAPGASAPPSPAPGPGPQARRGQAPSGAAARVAAGWAGPQYVPITPLRPTGARPAPSPDGRNPSFGPVLAASSEVSGAAAHAPRAYPGPPRTTATSAPPPPAQRNPAADVLLSVVHDAAVVQPYAWTNEQVAQLLSCAADLVVRGSIDGTAAGAFLLPPPPQATWAGPGGGGGQTGGAGTRARAGRSTGGSAQARVELQQLLLRLDGLLEPPGGPDDGGGGGGRGGGGGGRQAGRNGRAGGGAAELQDATEARRCLSPAAAAAATVAAATLGLRLGADGEVRRQLLRAFRRPPSALGTAAGGLRPRLRLRRRRGADLAGAGATPLASPPPGVAAGRPPLKLHAKRQQQQQRKQQGRRLAAAPRPLGPCEAADALWAVAKLQLPMPLTWLNAALRALAGPPPPLPPAATPSIRSAAAVPQRPSAPRPPLAKAAAVAAAAADVDPASTSAAHAKEAAAKAAAASGLALLGPRRLAAVAAAAVDLGAAAGREDVPRGWAAALFSVTQARMHRLSPTQLVSLLWALARGRRQPTGPWRRAAAAALATAVPVLAPWQVARVMTALGKMRLAMPYKLVVAMLSRLQSQLPSAQASDVAATVWALRFVTQPYTHLLPRLHRRLLLDLAAATQPLLGSLEPAQLTQLADGFSHLGLMPGEEWMRLHREACLRLKSRFTEANRVKVRQAYARMWTL